MGRGWDRGVERRERKVAEREGREEREERGGRDIYPPPNMVC